MERMSKITFWAAIAAFILIWSYCWTHVGQSQPRAHEYLVVNSAKAVIVQIWADSLHQDRPWGPAIFSRNGQVVAVLPYGSAWTKIEEFPK